MFMIFIKLANSKKPYTGMYIWGLISIFTSILMMGSTLTVSNYAPNSKFVKMLLVRAILGSLNAFLIMIAIPIMNIHILTVI